MRKKADGICYRLLQEIMGIYAFLILVIFPFYFQDRYYNIGDAKWDFFRVLTFGAGIILAVPFLFHTVEEFRQLRVESSERKLRLSFMDWFVMAYMAAALVSAVFSPYKNRVIWGYDGWYMGLIAQICFGLIYYFTSRYWKWDGMTIWGGLLTTFLVFLLGILMRFGIDPLGLYVGLDEEYIIEFLSTIGQATWYSSYVAVLFPPGLFGFWFYDNKYVRLLCGIFAAVGFMTIVTQNSDSIFAALATLFLALFCLSAESARGIRRFLETVILCLVSFRFVGLCQRFFLEKAVLPDTFSMVCSQGKPVWALLAVVLLLRFHFRSSKSGERFHAPGMKIIKTAVCVLAAAGLLAAIFYIYLNTAGKLPEEMQSRSNYLLFDETWGNHRGFSWKIAVKAYGGGDIFRKLFGCGPDGFSLFVQEFIEDKEIRQRISLFACAHNEWLNMLVNLGIVGAIAYAGIFVSGICRFLKKAKEYPELTAIALSVICYMAHNFFCYQQVVCTPVIFLLMGVGESLIRNGKPVQPEKT